MKKNKMNFIFMLVACLIMALAVWGPEKLAQYKDGRILDQITVESMEMGTEGYRYSMSSNEKLYLLSKCLSNQILPESELSAMTRMNSNDMEYQELTGTYAFVVSHKDGTGREITDEEIFAACNQELKTLKELGILPKTIKDTKTSTHSAVLYSAIDVPQPRNNVLVWKVELSTGTQNAKKENKLLDAYIDADTGKLYGFYVRTEMTWEDINPDEIIEKWSEYMGLEAWEAYEPVNPLAETTPHFKKYRFAGMEGGYTIVTIGFYEGINELFLKISK